MTVLNFLLARASEKTTYIGLAMIGIAIASGVQHGDTVSAIVQSALGVFLMLMREA